MTSKKVGFKRKKRWNGRSGKEGGIGPGAPNVQTSSRSFPGEGLTESEGMDAKG